MRHANKIPEKRVSLKQNSRNKLKLLQSIQHYIIHEDPVVGGISVFFAVKKISLNFIKYVDSIRISLKRPLILLNSLLMTIRTVHICIGASHCNTKRNYRPKTYQMAIATSKLHNKITEYWRKFIDHSLEAHVRFTNRNQTCTKCVQRPRVNEESWVKSWMTPLTCFGTRKWVNYWGLVTVEQKNKLQYSSC